jgi:Alkylmercury lyase
MKETTLAKILAVACSLGVVTAMAQTSTTVTTKDAATGTAITETSTTTSTGTISTYTPGTDYITFRTTTDAAPVRYYYSKDTTILDPEGHVVTWSAVRPDLPATVYYAREGDRMLVRKIVLSKPTVIEKETTTTTTTQKP